MSESSAIQEIEELAGQVTERGMKWAFHGEADVEADGRWLVQIGDTLTALLETARGLVRVRVQLAGVRNDSYFGPMATAMVGEIDAALSALADALHQSTTSQGGSR